MISLKYLIKKRKKKGEYEVRGLKEDRVSFNYREDTQSYLLEVGSDDKALTGLFVDPESPEKYQLTKEQSLFSDYVEYKRLPEAPKPTKEVKDAAELCCKKAVDREEKRECKLDFYRTHVCFTQYRSKETPKLNDA